MRSILLVVFMMIFCLRVDAQENITMPSVLDPSEVFADGVEIIETLPVLHSADEDDVIYYLASYADAWRTFEFPAEAEPDTYYYAESLLSDGTFLMRGHFALLFPGDYPEVYMRFDPLTERFTRLYGECGRDEYRESGLWVLEEGEEGVFHLCNTATGARTDPLPDEMQTKLFWDYDIPCVSVSSSPNRENLVVISCGYDVDDFLLAIASQHTGEWEHLSVAPRPTIMDYDDSYPGWVRWQSEQEFLLHVRIPPYAYATEIYRYLIDDDLSPINIIPSGEYRDMQYLNATQFLLLAVNNDAETFSVLEHNLTTDQQRSLLSNDCNTLRANCRNHYLRLVKGNDNLVIVVGRSPELVDSPGQTYDYWVVAIDSGETLYHSHTQPEPAYLSNSVWLGDDRIYMFWGWDTGTVIDISSGETIPEVIRHVAHEVSLDNRVIIQERDEDFLVLKIHDLVSSETTSLTHPLDATRYSIYSYWREDGSISVTLYDEIRSCCNERFPLRRWIVQP